VNYHLHYLEHLTQRDIELLALTAGMECSTLKQRMLERPNVIDDLLASLPLFEVIFGQCDDPLDPGASTFLAFGALVNRSAGDLRNASHVAEWSGPGKRLPIFDVDPLREFLEDGARRYFLIEFLNSFTSGGWGLAGRTRSGHGRFGEFILGDLVRVVDHLPPSERAGGYRRLGDVSLFLSGVFPDHTTSHPLPAEQRELLTRSAGAALSESLVTGDEVDFLEAVGAGWYRRAVDTASAAVGSGPLILRGVADRFTQARRILNYVSDRFLFGSKQGLMRPTG